MIVELQLANTDHTEVPLKEDIDYWVTATLSAIDQQPSTIVVRVVDEEEMVDLNFRFRGKNNPTNVLAFPFESVTGVDHDSLGDIVICASVVKNESNQQDKPMSSHFALMVIHGTLHLCGFDHQKDDEATAMEAVEKKVLARVGLI